MLRQAGAGHRSRAFHPYLIESPEFRVYGAKIICGAVLGGRFSESRQIILFQSLHSAGFELESAQHERRQRNCGVRRH